MLKPPAARNRGMKNLAARNRGMKHLAARRHDRLLMPRRRIRQPTGRHITQARRRSRNGRSCQKRSLHSPHPTLSPEVGERVFSVLLRAEA
jgi:hypothetical protein